MLVCFFLQEINIVLHDLFGPGLVQSSISYPYINMTKQLTNLIFSPKQYIVNLS